MADKKHKRKKGEKKETKKVDDVEFYKHYETFYESAPPGYIQDEKEKPEDSIPDLPENEQAREFLAKAPSKGLWMPLGKEVKVMKCWRCKSYGHRTGDRECPLFTSGNQTIEKFRMAHEDPMHEFIVEKKKTEKEQRIEQLKALLDEPTTTESDSSDSSSSSGSSSHSKHKKHKKMKRKHHKSKEESKISEKQINNDHNSKKTKKKNNKKREYKDKHHDRKSCTTRDSRHKSKKHKSYGTSSDSKKHKSYGTSSDSN